MDSRKNKIRKIFAIIMLIQYTWSASATNIDCNGKSFHCVNSTHFMICVDLGGGFSKTVNDFAIQCPPTTVCSENNNLECTYQLPTNTQSADPSHATEDYTTDSGITTTISNESTKMISSTNNTNVIGLFNENLNKMDVTTYANYSPDVQTYNDEDSATPKLLSNNNASTNYDDPKILEATPDTYLKEILSPKTLESNDQNSYDYFDLQTFTVQSLEADTIRNIEITTVRSDGLTLKNNASLNSLTYTFYETTIETTTKESSTLLDQKHQKVENQKSNSDFITKYIPEIHTTTPTTLTYYPRIQENNYLKNSSSRTENIVTPPMLDLDGPKRHENISEYKRRNSLTSVTVATEIGDVSESNVLQTTDHSNFNSTTIESKHELTTKVNELGQITRIELFNTLSHSELNVSQIQENINRTNLPSTLEPRNTSLKYVTEPKQHVQGTRLSGISYNNSEMLISHRRGYTSTEYSPATLKNEVPDNIRSIAAIKITNIMNSYDDKLIPKNSTTTATVNEIGREIINETISSLSYVDDYTYSPIYQLEETSTITTDNFYFDHTISTIEQQYGTTQQELNVLDRKIKDKPLIISASYEELTLEVTVPGNITKNTPGDIKQNSPTTQELNVSDPKIQEIQLNTSPSYKQLTFEVTVPGDITKNTSGDVTQYLITKHELNVSDQKIQEKQLNTPPSYKHLTLEVTIPGDITKNTPSDITQYPITTQELNVLGKKIQDKQLVTSPSNEQLNLKVTDPSNIIINTPANIIPYLTPIIQDLNVSIQNIQEKQLNTTSSYEQLPLKVTVEGYITPYLTTTTEELKVSDQKIQEKPLSTSPSYEQIPLKVTVEGDIITKHANISNLLVNSTFNLTNDDLSSLILLTRLDSTIKSKQHLSTTYGPMEKTIASSNYVNSNKNLQILNRNQISTEVSDKEFTSTENSLTLNYYAFNTGNITEFNKTDHDNYKYGIMTMTPHLNITDQNVELIAAEISRNTIQDNGIQMSPSPTENPYSYDTSLKINNSISKFELNIQEKTRQDNKTSPSHEQYMSEINLPGNIRTMDLNTSDSSDNIATPLSNYDLITMLSTLMQSTVPEQGSHIKEAIESTTISYNNFLENIPERHLKVQYNSTQSNHRFFDIETLVKNETTSTPYYENATTTPGIYDEVSKMKINKSTTMKPDLTPKEIFNSVSEIGMIQNEQLNETLPLSNSDLNYITTPLSQDGKNASITWRHIIFTTAKNTIMPKNITANINSSYVRINSNNINIGTLEYEEPKRETMIVPKIDGILLHKYTTDVTIQKQETFNDNMTLTPRDKNIYTTEKPLMEGYNIIKTDLVSNKYLTTENAKDIVSNMTNNEVKDTSITAKNNKDNYIHVIHVHESGNKTTDAVVNNEPELYIAEANGTNAANKTLYEKPFKNYFSSNESSTHVEISNLNEAKINSTFVKILNSKIMDSTPTKTGISKSIAIESTSKLYVENYKANDTLENNNLTLATANSTSQTTTKIAIGYSESVTEDFKQGSHNVTLKVPLQKDDLDLNFSERNYKAETNDHTRKDENLVMAPKVISNVNNRIFAAPNIVNTESLNNSNYRMKANKRSTSTVPFRCNFGSRGRFADKNNCMKYYICIGLSEPILGECPSSTVFSEIKKQCTKNLSHCLRNNQFRCTQKGRFSDLLRSNIYYICVNSDTGYVRFQFQCRTGFHLNKTSVRCVEDIKYQSQMISISTNSNSNKGSDQSTVERKSLEKKQIKEEANHICKKEGKFPDATDCRTYYVCTKNASKSVFRRRTKKCDSDEVFHREKKKCVDNDSYECI